ncbi:MAG TPA: hypothetical protein VF166_12515 [Gemmatimonadaceae bacterium]
MIRVLVRVLVRIVLLAAAFALATIGFGWWAVALVAAAWGVAARTLRGAAFAAGVAALLAWSALLAWGAVHGPVAELAVKLAAVMQIPPVALVVATLVFPALLAWSAAAVAGAATGAIAAHAQQS